jgi:hypothetical protein
MQTKTPDSISLFITGDYHPTTELTSFIEKGNGAEEIFGPLLPYIESSDLAVVHLEIPATDKNKQMPKGGLYGKTDRTCIKLLSDAGFKLCTFASNHTLDYGATGYLDTAEYCKEFGLSVVGAGVNTTKAREPYVSEINKVKFAILNYTETEFNIASENYPGANPLDLINIYQDIKSLKSKVDHIIVIIHAGQDFIFHPSPRIKKVYRFIADQKVSAIISHHSHYISSFESYKNVPISYGLGHLVYYYNKNDVFTRLFNVAQLTLTKTTCELKLLPFYFDAANNKVALLDKDNAELLFKKQEELNESIKDDSVLYKKWYEEISKEDIVRNLFLLSGYPYILFRVFKKLKLLPQLKKLLLVNKERFLPIWNISRCPRHITSVNYLFNSLFYKNISK